MTAKDAKSQIQIVSLAALRTFVAGQPSLAANPFGAFYQTVSAVDAKQHASLVMVLT
jgi:hypothetical protein